MNKVNLLFSLLFFYITSVIGQIPTTGDYRTAASGNWSSLSSWEVRDAAGNWTTPLSLPTSSNNVYIQRGHTIAVDFAASCNDLHLDLNGILSIGSNFVLISGKIRAFAAVATTAVTGSLDGTFYTDNPSQVSLNASMVVSSNTGGLKFIGGTRNLNLSTEWGSNGTGNVSVIFAMDPGTTGTLGAGFKAKTFTFQSGTITTSQFMSAGVAGTGVAFVIKSGAKFSTSRSGSASIGFSSTNKCDNITIESGGTLEINATDPRIDCTSFTNNGTVIYLGGAGTLAQPTPTSLGLGAVLINSYKNLYLAGTGIKSIPAGQTISLSDTLKISNGSCILGSTGTLAYGLNAYLLFDIGNSATATANLPGTSFEWPTTAAPQNIEIRSGTVTFVNNVAPSTTSNRTITGNLILSGGFFSINTANSATFSNASSIIRKSNSGGLSFSTGSYVVGSVAGDMINVIIDAGTSVTETKEFLPTVSNGKINLSIASGSNYTIGARSINNLTNSGILIMNASGLIINGDISGLGTISGNALYSLTINGNGPTTSTLNFTSGFANLFDFTINRSGTGAMVTLGTNLTVARDLFLMSGVLNDNGKVISVYRHISYNGGAVGTGTHASGVGGKIVMFCNYLTQNSYYVGSTSLGNLEFNYNTYKLPRAATSFTVDNMNFANTNNKFNLYGYNVLVKKDLTGAGTDSIINQSVPFVAYAHLTMSGVSNIISGITVMDTLEIAAGANITSNLSFSAKKIILNGFFNDGGNIITNTGNLIGSGTHTGSGRISMTGAGKSISGIGLSLGSLEIATGTANTITAGNNFTVSQNLLLTSGTLSDGGNTITVNQNLSGTTGIHTGSGEIKMIGVNFSISNVVVDSLEISSSAEITTTSNFTINKGLFLLGTLNDGGNMISIAGNIFGSGTHSGTGRIKMTGTAKSINGRPTLNNVEIVTGASTSAGFGAIITGTLYMNGGNITVDSLNGAPNTLTFKNNSSIIRTSGNLNINGGIVQMGTATTDLITVFINGNFTSATGSGSSNELPSVHVGNIDLTINDGFSYSIRSNSKYVRNLNVSNGHLLCGFDTLTQTGYNLAVNNLATISGDFYLDSTAFDFTGNSTVPAVLAAAGPFKVGPSLIINATGKLKFGNVNNKTLFSNGLLVLRSRNTGTASVGDVTNGGMNSGNRISGATTVERFISNIRNLINNSDPTVKAWRLIAMPTKHDYQTIKQSWQEGASLNANPNPGYGTQIVSSGISWASNGFDTVANGPSVKYFDPVSNAYIGISNTNSPMENGKAYMVFIRGSRAKTQISQSPDTTILREKGTLNTGDTTFTVGTAGNQFVCLPNPFPSAIDFRQSLTTSNNIAPYVYLYDPRMGSYGAFVTVGADGTSTSSLSYPSGVAYIQSCQGFFVKTTSGPGSITFNENSKIDGSAMTFRSDNTNTKSLLKLNLLKNQNGVFELSDGLMHLFDSSHNNNVDVNDALKFNNMYENISIKNSGKNLSIENRKQIKVSDTFYYSLNVRQGSYQLEFIPDNIQHDGFDAYLEDKYLSSTTFISLSDTTIIGFFVNADSGSYAADRFRLVFKPILTLPLCFTSLTAVEKDKNVLVSWKVNNEVNINIYQVQRSFDGVSFSSIGNKNVNGIASVSAYDYTDLSPSQGLNYYRIRSIGINGESQYSKIVSVKIENKAQGFSVSPNPIGKDHNIILSNENLSAGKYEVSLYDFTGRKVFITSWIKNDKYSTFNCQLPKTLSTGEYRLCINTEQNRVCESILID